MSDIERFDNSYALSWTPCYHRQMDRSNGYEAVSEEFLAGRGSRSRSAGIGVKEVRKWARTLPRGSSVSTAVNERATFDARVTDGHLGIAKT